MFELYDLRNNFTYYHDFYITAREKSYSDASRKNNVKLSATHLMPDSKLMADYIKENNFIGYFIEDEVKEYDLVKIKLKEEMPINPIEIIYSKKQLIKLPGTL